jgi:formamidopyrimidine-DNA glycosylase
MPELPDVEGFRRVAREAAGRRIDRVDVIDRVLLTGGRADAVEGKRFADPLRHGKWLVLPAGEAEVLMQFGMPATSASDALRPRGCAGSTGSPRWG